MNNLSEIVISNEDIVRFAILFGDSDASSFKTNLSKMIELILYQEHPNSMSIVDIITKIKELYLMEFTEEEVKSVIHDNKKGKFEISQNSRNYELTPKAFQAIQERYTRKDISLMIKRFYDEHSEFAELGLQAVEDIIKKYIFLKFNKDAKTLKWILTLDVNQVYEEDRIEDFNEIEKEVLNSFFSWENEEKNVLVYEIISSALQYCKMTTRKENAISNSIFRGKTFYLDLNIIFRLAGFNLAERQEVTGSFIRKCKECGIKIKYTNFTKAELDWTLDSSVEGIKKYTSGKAPIGKEAMHMLKPKMRNKDLYYVYSDWAKDTVNHRYYDFKEFRRYLDRRVEDVLRGFERDDIQTHNELTTKEIFQAYVEELNEFKLKNGKEFVHDKALNTDIENYMFIEKKASSENTASLIDKRTFFISTDQRFINWAVSKKPGSVPSFFLPSFWYSLMLRYDGRATRDDYSAFCQFLKLRPAYKEVDLEETRDKIAMKIFELDESSAMKDEIAIDISEKIREHSKELSDEEIEVVFAESVNSVIDKKISEAVQKEREENEEKMEMKLQGSFNEGEKTGEDNAIHSIAVDEAERNRKIKQFIRVGCVIVIIIAIFIIKKNYNAADEGNLITKIANFYALPVVTILVSILLYFMTAILGNTNILTEDIEKLEAKYKRKVK